MARLWMASFEDQGAKPTVGSEVKIFTAATSYVTGCRGFGNALALDSGGSDVRGYITWNNSAFSIGGSPTTSMRAWVRIPSASGWPSTDALIYGHDLNGATSITVTVLTTGHLRFTSPSGSSDVAINQDQWYCIESQAAYGTNAACSFKLDDSTVHTGTWTTASTQPVLTVGWIGFPGANKVIQIDDCAFNDDSGASNTSWCGYNGRIKELIVASDVSIGNWVAGAGGTTSLFDAMNNKPPVGVALGSATNTSQIKNIISGTSSADFDTVAYDSVGITADDTIIAVASHCSMGESATFLTGHHELASNPVQGPLDSSENYFGVGTAGTFPTGWNWNGSPSAPSRHKQAIANTPSVTISQGARIRITKTLASTNATMVDYASVLVEYEPPTGPPLVGSTQVLFGGGL